MRRVRQTGAKGWESIDAGGRLNSFRSNQYYSVPTSIDADGAKVRLFRLGNREQLAVRR